MCTQIYQVYEDIPQSSWKETFKTTMIDVKSEEYYVCQDGLNIDHIKNKKSI